MATIRKRGKGHQRDYFDPTGKRVRKSFKKKRMPRLGLESVCHSLQKVGILTLKRNTRQL